MQIAIHPVPATKYPLGTGLIGGFNIMTGWFPRRRMGGGVHWAMFSPLKPLLARAMIVALAAGVLGACSSSETLGEGVTLAKAGQAAAAQMQRNVTLSDATITGVSQAIAFNDGFNNAIDNPASKAVLSDIDDIQKGLVPYGKMLGSLASAYVALGDLASYDAVGSFNSSVDSLAKDATNLGTAVGKLISIPSDVGSGVKAVGGLIIGGIQAGQVKDASRQIETVLKQVISLLSDPRTRQKLVAAPQLVTGLMDQAAATVFLQGGFTYGPVLDSLGEPLGLKSTKESDAAVKGNPALKRGVNAVVVALVKKKVDAAAASYDTSLAVLKDLEKQHAQLQADQPVNLTTIISGLGQLQTLAASMTPPKGK